MIANAKAPIIMKTIVLFFKGDIFDLPPLIAIIDSLRNKYHIILISQMYIENVSKFKELYKDYNIELITYYPLSKSRLIRERIYNRVRRILFSYKIKKQFVDLKYDLLWVIHEDTMYKFNELLLKKKYICSIYELNDTRKYILEKIKPIVQKADAVFVPEYNRACILRSWLQLRDTPSVIPNKPLNHPLQRNLQCDFQEFFPQDKYTLIYQGLVIKERKIDAFCDAVQSFDNVQLVVMGNGYGQEEYRNYLISTYPNIKFIDFVTPPKHLNVTSNAQIGIVTYDFSSLNTIFCAPNKIWEYAGFSIPMIGNAIPGLINEIDKFNAGICVNTEDSEQIKKAIQNIIGNYDFYKDGAYKLYNSIDISRLINNIVIDNIS